jgi:hippurate hydrolase
LVLGKEKVDELALRMTAEDFAFYSHLVPVCFYRVGVADSSRSVNYGVHHPKFDIDPLSIKVAMKSFTSLAFI